MISELFDIYIRNFPFIVRDEETVLGILKNRDNRVIEKRNDQKELIGVSVINRNTIILLCVDEEYRNRGLGTELLAESELIVKNNGYEEINVGDGFDYLMPGVPTSKRYYEAENENLYENISETASDFFEKRGYEHSWDCNCFDMRFLLKDFSNEKHSVGDIIDGISYRWAETTDMEEICKCTDDACEEFTQWYRNEELYKEDSGQKVLIAADNNEVVGTLIVDTEAEGQGLGSIGCTTVKRKYQGRHIAVNLVVLGTKYLRDMGLKEAYLSYTYSGLDHLYGYAGYKICIYYMMAKKGLKMNG